MDRAIHSSTAAHDSHRRTSPEIQARRAAAPVLHQACGFRGHARGEGFAAGEVCGCGFALVGCR